MNVRPHVCDGIQCEEIRHLRAAHWKYRAIARHLGISVYFIQRSVGAHALPRHRLGAASCLDCHRIIDPRVPETQLLEADECCGWCGHRYDGDSRLTVPLLMRLAQAEAQSADGARRVQDLRVWSLRVRSNSAEVRTRPSARPVQRERA